MWTPWQNATFISFAAPTTARVRLSGYENNRVAACGNIKEGQSALIRCFSQNIVSALAIETGVEPASRPHAGLTAGCRRGNFAFGRIARRAE